MPPTTTRRLLTPATVAPAVVALVVGALLASAASPASAAERAASTAARVAAQQHGAPSTTTVTLVTGDVVRVLTQPDGKRRCRCCPAPDGTVPQAAINQVGTHLYVVPRVGDPAAVGAPAEPGPVRRHRR